MGIVPSMIWGGVCTLAVVGSYLGLFPAAAQARPLPRTRRIDGDTSRIS